MNIHKKILLGIAVFSATFGSIAGEVDSNQIVTFSSGTPALASEVNSNFDVLIAAINDNAQRLTALEEAASSSDQPADLMELLTGASFKLVGIDSKLEAGSYNNQPHIGSQLETFSQSITLLDGGTFISGAGNYKQREVSFLPSAFCCGDDANEEFPESTSTSTWTLSGNILTLFFNEDEDGINEFQFIVSQDANILIFNTPGRFNVDSGFDEGTPFEDDDFIASIIIGVRVPQ